MDKSLLSAATKQALPNRSASDDQYYKLLRFTQKLRGLHPELPFSVAVNILHVVAHLFTHAMKVPFAARGPSF